MLEVVSSILALDSSLAMQFPITQDIPTASGSSRILLQPDCKKDLIDE